jgi:peptide-methionine (S)-S-oxide reductase
VEVEFDPAEISYEELLDTFWSIHDPTTLNRQGFDIGSQYRSAVFFHTDEQRAAAERSHAAEQERLAANGRGLLGRRREIVTELEPASTFWPAEDYHQRYLEKRGQATCTVALSGRAPARPASTP